MIDIGDMVVIKNSLHYSTYASPIYHNLGLVLDIYDDQFDNIEGIEVLLDNQEIMYCFPEEIRVCFRV